MVWAPNAKEIELVGDFNDWDGSSHKLENLYDSGVWSIFTTDLSQGDIYKYNVVGCDDVSRLKSDPYGTYAELRPETASKVFDLGKFNWSDKKYIEQKNKKSVYKYIVADSAGEYEFAKLLDHDEDVLLFTKLKKGKFIIDTPFGGYSPDWGIIYRIDEDEAGIYFIVETKWDKNLEDLTDIEKGKIHCAEQYFEDINPEVTFSWVNSWNKFTRDVKKKKDSLAYI